MINLTRKVITAKDIQEINYKTYMIWVYMDLAEKAITDIERLSTKNDINRQIIKQKINGMTKLSLEFREALNREIGKNPEVVELFGAVSDKLEVMFKTNAYVGLKEELKL
ncbi:MAG TPA: hypothetical protein VK152_00240 [Paludibacter sp.]|nr:hypothetical protein [Paludibacter sp.]